MKIIEIQNNNEMQSYVMYEMGEAKFADVIESAFKKKHGFHPEIAYKLGSFLFIPQERSKHEEAVQSNSNGK
jgi:hypothetical protein